MADAKPAKGEAKPIEDVARPGKSAPAETSKPVIVTNRPIIKDPMVVEDKTEAPAEPTTAKIAGSSRIKLQPLTPETPEPEPEPEKTDDGPAEPEPETETETTESEADEGDKGTSPDLAAAEKEAAEAAKRDTELQKLVDSKRYFLPINSVEKRRSKRFVALGIVLSLLLLAAWVNIALDAGLIEIPGIKPVTHFFSI